MTAGREHIIIGGGIIGVCVALELATRGRDVVLLERGEVGGPSPMASSGVAARMFRSAYGADRRRTRLCSAALRRWGEYEDAAGETLIDRCGWVVFDAVAPEVRQRWPHYAQWPGPGFGTESAAVLRDEGLPHDWLTQDQLVERYPEIARNQYYDTALVDYTAGLVRADVAVRAISRLAARAGAEIREHEAVEELVFHNERVDRVITAKEQYRPTDSVILAAGCQNVVWSKPLQGVVRTVGERTLYLRPSDASRFRPDRFPVVGHFAFPTDRVGTVHVSPGGSLDYEIEVDPRRDELGDVVEDHAVSTAFVRDTRRILETWIPGLADAQVASQHRCYYPVTPHDDYLLFRRGNVVTLVACASGTGFKTAPVTAEIGVELALRADAEGLVHPHDQPAFRPENLAP